MTYYSIIFSAAKAAKISGILLIAICLHESNDFMYDYTQYDHGTPSYSVCQIKESTARMLGFKGKTEELRNQIVAIKYSALYVKYQQDRYGEDWCKITSAYNAGTFIESKKSPGKPKNMGYVRKVQKKLAEDIRDKLSCGEEKK